MSDGVRQLTRLPTGVTGLDDVLGGGLLARRSYLIFGDSGSGKTVLASQIAFHHVANGGRAVFVTLLVEDNARLLENLASLTFFDPHCIPDRLYLVSGYGSLQGGLGELAKMLHEVVHSHRAELLIIDTVDVIGEQAHSPIEFQEFLHRLQAILGTLGCTGILLSHRTGATPSPVHPVVDALVQLTNETNGLRALRHLRVTKLRGSGYLEGRHAFDIQRSGIVLFPRGETLLATGDILSEEPRPLMPFGIAGIDEMLRGGVLSATSTILLGSAGSGKTTFGLHFLTEGARRGERALYFGFYERTSRLCAQAEAIGLPLRALITSGLVDTVWQAALEHPADALVHRLLESVQGHRATRLVVDGLNAFVNVAEWPERLGRLFTALTNRLRDNGVTAVFTMETQEQLSRTIELPIQGMSAIAENILFLHQVEVRSELQRFVSIFKTRERGFDHRIRRFTIGDQGVVIGREFERLESLLSGQSHALKRDEE
jgi:circadian clock protein KaiC